MNADRDLSDPALDALLREHSAEVPPNHVEATVLAAAHRAVDSGPRDYERALARQPWRWWMPLAAAAAIGVVVIGVMPLAPTSLDETSPAVGDSQAVRPSDRGAIRSEAAKTDSSAASQPEAPASVAPLADAAPPAARMPEAVPQIAPPAARMPEAVPQVAPPSNAVPLPKREARPQASEAPRATSKQESANAVTRPAPSAESERSHPSLPATQQPEAATPPSVEARPSTAPSRRSASDQGSISDQGLVTGRARADKELDSGPHDAAEWIVRIRTLREDGKLAEATRELGRFRAAFDDADARLPADLRAWADSLR